MRPIPLPVLLLPILLHASAARGQTGSAEPGQGPQDTEGPGGPPIPAEALAGTEYASLNLVFGKPLAPGSRWGFFHQSTLVASYEDGEDDLSLRASSRSTRPPGYV